MPAKKTASQPDNCNIDNRNIDSINGFDAWVEWALHREDTREYVPFDVGTLIPIVDPLDANKLAHLMKTAKQGTVEVHLTPENREEGTAFLRSWIRANGKNRDRRKGHYMTLAEAFRASFIAEGTNFVVDKGGQVNDGGHSSVAVAIAFYPPSLFYGLERNDKPITEEVQSDDGKKAKQPVKANSPKGEELLADESGWYIAGPDGLVYGSKTYADYSADFPLVGDFDSDGRYIEGTGMETRLPKEGIRIRVTVNTPPDRALKLAETRLAATAMDYIQSVGPLRELLASSDMPASLVPKLGEVLRTVYYRVNHLYKGGNLISYGYVSKGGKPTLSDAPAWLLTFLPLLMSVLRYITSSEGKLLAWPLWTADKTTQKGGVSLANGLTAMVVSSPEGAKRIADLLLLPAATPRSSLSEGVVRMLDAIVVGKNMPVESNDIVIQALIEYGMGADDPIASAREMGKGTNGEAIRSWQVADNRTGTHWDDSDTLDLSDGTLSMVQRMDAMRQRVNDLLGIEGSKKSLQATRKGKGVRGTRGVRK